jgi:eukaryotic-like serine/threonine-protein kinase
MPVPATVAEFADLVRRSGLVPASQLDELLRRAQPPATADQAASALVRDGLLTFFQAKQLRQGRYKRFTIGAKYRLLELIGAGGMGAVYLCEHTIMKRLVALKVLPTDKLDDQSNLDRFFREARAVAALDHPNIVRAYDIDQFEKLHFLVMEYVDGTSLQEIVARYTFEKKQLDPIRAAHYTAQAAIGMQHAHELGMVHRDIKPGNVLLDRNGVIKVLDMGLARFFHKQQDSVTEKYDDKCVLGTADYLAPEQAVSNVVDVRADIYALGGTLYFMLTGQTPFPDGTVAAKLVAHQTREPKPVDEYRSDVPPGLLAVLRTMMAKDANDRYQTPIEVAEALAEWTAIPIDPPPEREMPALCPLVRALMSGPADRSSQSGSLSKALFGPGRGVFARGAGSSGSGSRPPAASSSSTAAQSGAGTGASYVAFPTVSPSDVSKARAKPEPVGALSTGRAPASPTAPLQPPSGSTKGKPPRPSERAERAKPIPVPARAPNRAWLFAAAGVAVLALVAGAAAIAYQLGKGSKEQLPATNTDTPKPPGGPPQPPDPVPGAADDILTPALALQREGEEVTIEFRVLAVGGDTNMYLNSEANFRTGGNFAVRVSAAYFKAAGDQQKALFEETKREFEGKLIRARGKVLRDAMHNGAYIEVRSPKQIVSVNR